MTPSGAERPIAQISPLPPPYGGVSVHVRRLAAALAASGFRVVAYSGEGSDPIQGVEVVRLETFSWRGWLRSGGRRLGASVLHCHEGWEWAPALLLALASGSRVVVTVHSEVTMDALATFPWYYRLAARLLLASSRVRWIAVSPRIGERLERLGAKADSLAVAPAYMPIAVGDADSSALPEGLREFVSSHHPVLTVYGWRVAVAPDGSDLYGFDLAIQAVEQLRATWPGCGLVVLVPGGEPVEGIARLRREVAERGLDPSVCLWSAPLADPTPLWSATDVYVRPSRTDGDAVSVREVLALGGAVVASDCCDRPEGVRLFASGDAGSLRDAVLAEMSAPPALAGPDASNDDPMSVIAWAYCLPSGSSLPGAR